jgi:DNA-binding XRE family transcriptional regulator
MSNTSDLNTFLAEAPIAGVITLEGARYVVLSEREYQRLQVAAGEAEPVLPPADAEGNRPATESLRVLLAQKLLRRRRVAGLSQVELARRAGVRAETINRIEKGKHSPSVETVERITKALEAAEGYSETSGLPAGQRRRQARGKRK